MWIFAGVYESDSFKKAEVRMKTVLIRCALVGVLWSLAAASLAVAAPQTETSTPKGADLKLKGCISSDGELVVKGKTSKNISLTGMDISAHTGHEVVLHGKWESEEARKFNVKSLDMVSETCKPDGKTNGPGLGPNPPPQPPPPPSPKK